MLARAPHNFYAHPLRDLSGIYFAHPLHDSIAEDARYIRLLHRGTQLREGLPERWRLVGRYEGARSIVEAALLQEHFSAATRVLSGVNVMTIHKSKGKQFD